MTRKRSRQELINVSGDLCYEIWMLDHMVQILTSDLTCTQPVHNAFINSFAIHTRNIIDFLYEQKSRAKNDAILAEHYFFSAQDWISMRPDWPEGLKDAKIRCDKQVAHLTYTRQKREHWDYEGIKKALLIPLSVFIKNVDRALLGKYYAPIEHLFK
jgi:hypothetical protein